MPEPELQDLDNQIHALLNKPPVDPTRILWYLAESCTRMEDAAFWILTSAAAYLKLGTPLRRPDYNFDGEGSTAAAFYWDHLFPCWEPRRKA